MSVKYTKNNYSKYAWQCEYKRQRFITEYNTITRRIAKLLLQSSFDEKEENVIEAYRLIHEELLVTIMYFLDDFGLIELPKKKKYE